MADKEKPIPKRCRWCKWSMRIYAQRYVCLKHKAEGTTSDGEPVDSPRKVLGDDTCKKYKPYVKRYDATMRPNTGVKL